MTAAINPAARRARRLVHGEIWSARSSRSQDVDDVAVLDEIRLVIEALDAVRLRCRPGQQTFNAP